MHYVLEQGKKMCNPVTDEQPIQAGNVCAMETRKLGLMSRYDSKKNHYLTLPYIQLSGLSLILREPTLPNQVSTSTVKCSQVCTRRQSI